MVEIFHVIAALAAAIILFVVIGAGIVVLVILWIERDMVKETVQREFVKAGKWPPKWTRRSK
jgi:hypothetical protein